MNYAKRSYSAWWFYCGIRIWKRGDRWGAVVCMDDALGSPSVEFNARVRRVRAWMMSQLTGGSARGDIQKMVG